MKIENKVKDLQVTDTKTFLSWDFNTLKDTKRDVTKLKNSMAKSGWSFPIIVWNNPDTKKPYVIDGTGRKLAVVELLKENHEIDEIPYVTIEAENLADAKAKALEVSSQFGNITKDSFLSFTEDMELDFDTFEIDGVEDYIFDKNYEDSGSVTLEERFVVPPFSILDTKQGYWKKRKADWLTKMPNIEESREDTLYANSNSSIGKKMSNIGTTSHFDPVLAELMYKWFCPKNGKILDPFGGEQTKGVVAGELGYEYSAVEFRQEQVDVNNKTTQNYKGINYICGDSNNIDTLITESDFDFCFTSPPYYDLEVYSKEDMSALGTYKEFMQQYKNIFKKCIDKLKDDSFIAVKICEIRDKKTGVYRNFVGDNITIFNELGVHYYNEIILLNSIGTLPLRITGQFNSGRKVGKIHQNILLFYKGNVNNIGSKFGEVVSDSDFKDLEVSDVEINE